MKDLVETTRLESQLDQPPLCPIAGTPMRPHIDLPCDRRRPDDPRRWTIWWNDTSQFGQIHPRPDAREVRGFYDVDEYYTHPEGVHADPQAEARAVGLTGKILGSLAYRLENGAEPTRAWWRSIIPQSAREALEIGCGDGDRMLTFAPFLDAVRGVEPDPHAVTVARDQRGLDVHEGTAEALPEAVRDRRYGLIVFTYVLDHTLDPVLSLANARELLADDGVMSIEVPNHASAGARSMGNAWRWLDAPRQLNFFTPDSLQACARAAGLRVRKVLYRGYVRQFMPDWIVEEATLSAQMQGRAVTQSDIDRQVRHATRHFARTALAAPRHKYDSVRILCSRD